jgi:hypothetical protein
MTVNLAMDGGLDNPVVAKALVMAALARIVDGGGAVLARVSQLGPRLTANA